MENQELIALLESELNFLINKAHRSGLSYWQILKVLLIYFEDLVAQVENEGGK